MSIVKQILIPIGWFVLLAVILLTVFNFDRIYATVGKKLQKDYIDQRIISTANIAMPDMMLNTGSIGLDSFVYIKTRRDIQESFYIKYPQMEQILQRFAGNSTIIYSPFNNLLGIFVPKDVGVDQNVSVYNSQGKVQEFSIHEQGGNYVKSIARSCSWVSPENILCIIDISSIVPEGKISESQRHFYLLNTADGSTTLVKKEEPTDTNNLFVMDVGAPYIIQMTYGGKQISLYSNSDFSLFKTIDLPSDINPTSPQSGPSGGQAQCHFLGRESIFCFDYKVSLDDLANGTSIYYVYDMTNSVWTSIPHPLWDPQLGKEQFIFNATSPYLFINECLLSWREKFTIGGNTSHCERTGYYLEKPGKEKIKVMEINKKDGGPNIMSIFTDDGKFYLTVGNGTVPVDYYYIIDPSKY